MSMKPPSRKDCNEMQPSQSGHTVILDLIPHFPANVQETCAKQLARLGVIMAGWLQACQMSSLHSNHRIWWNVGTEQQALHSKDPQSWSAHVMIMNLLVVCTRAALSLHM